MTYPAVPLGNQWTNGEELNAVKMNARIDANFNALLTASPAYFFGSLLTSTAITAAALFNYTTIVADTVSGWDATNHKYIFKTAGLYVVTAALKANSSGGSFAIQFLKNGINYILGGNIATVTFDGVSATFVGQFAVNDNIAVSSTANFTTQSDSPAHNNYLIVAQVNYI